MIRDTLEQIKILVIEDNLIASKTAQIILEAHRCLVDCVATGQGALDKLNQSYDLILLDLGLPDLNGFEVAEKIKSSKKPLAKSTIVILTAFDSKENRQLAQQLKINRYIAKPFTMEKCDFLLKEILYLPS